MALKATTRPEAGRARMIGLPLRVAAVDRRRGCWSGAHATPGLGEQVAARLAPWREVAETAVRNAAAGSPVAALLPAKEVAHGVVAGFLGLELLAALDGDRTAAPALFDRARLVAGFLDLIGASFPPGHFTGGQT